MRHYLLNHYLGRAVFAVLADMTCFVGASGLTWYLLSPAFSASSYAFATAAGAIATFVALYYGGAYSLDVLGSGRRTLESVVGVMGVAFIVALGVYLAVHTAPQAIEALAHTAALYFPMLIAERLGFRWISSLPLFTERLLIIGTSDLGIAIARITNARRNLGTQIIGFISDDFSHERAVIEGIPVVGKAHELKKVIEELRINRVVVASKDRNEHFPAEDLLLEKLRGRKVDSGVAFYERITGRVYLQDLRASYLIFSNGFRLSPFATATKRAIDIVVSAIGLAVVSPILALCALLIRLDSTGPALYGQSRVGKDGKLFSVIKLRTMRDGAEADTGPVWTRNDDDRVTRVGRLLRMTRIDEFPQLWSVLKGDMSLVGPRPERPEFVESLTEAYPYFRLRSALTPGLTGWAQIRHGYVNEIEGFEEKLAYDLYYMKYRSTTMDLLILWKTAKTVLLLSGV